MTTPVSGTSSTSITRDYVPLAKRPSITSVSDGEEHFSPDEACERRRERRRAQNRAAQRAFRARKEETIKESSTRLDALQDELTRLQSNNDSLSSTLSTLRARITLLQKENTQLRQNSVGNWDGFDLSDLDLDLDMDVDSVQLPEPTTTMSARLVAPPFKTEKSHDSGVYDMRGVARLQPGIRHVIDGSTAYPST